VTESRPRHLRIVNSEAEPIPAGPRVWLLLGERQGDNAQVLALGRALQQDLGWRSEIKQLHYDPDCDVPLRDRGSSLIGIDLAVSDALTPPWPDVVIAVGRRAAPASRWLKDQTGGRLLNVHLGRPRVAFNHFDLIVTTPQYALPAAPNVTRLMLPIIMHDEAELAEEAKRWEERFRSLPRPWTAVLVGGPTAQLRFDREVGAELVSLAKTHVGPTGTLLVTTSPRTPVEIADLFERELGARHYLYRWSRQAPNPYRALLKLADDFIVTNDSVSMIAEAVDMTKPVYVFEVPRRPRREGGGITKSIKRYFHRRRERRLLAGLRSDVVDTAYDALTRLGRARPRRSVDAFDRQLYKAGLARPLLPVRDEARGWAPRRLPKEERDMVVAKIRDCLAAKHAGTSEA